jgi:hypothetical protein
MSRSAWLTLVLVAVSVAALASGRVAIEMERVTLGAGLVAEVQALAGKPPPPELSQRVTDAAGCYPRLVPPDKACLYVWGHPTRADYVELVAARIRDKGSGEATRWGIAAGVFWILAAMTAWQAVRPPRGPTPHRSRRPLQRRLPAAGSPPGARSPFGR